jgi:hypothetical protein
MQKCYINLVYFAVKSTSNNMNALRAAAYARARKPDMGWRGVRIKKKVVDKVGNICDNKLTSEIDKMDTDNKETKKDKTSTEYSRVFLFIMPCASNRPKRSVSNSLRGALLF